MPASRYRGARTRAMPTHYAARSCPALAGCGRAVEHTCGGFVQLTGGERLQWLVVHAAVQRIAAVCRVCRVRATARWTSYSVRVARGDVSVCPERHGAV